MTEITNLSVLPTKSNDANDTAIQRLEDGKTFSIDAIVGENSDRILAEREIKVIEWNSLAFHVVVVLAIGGIGTLFHNLNAPMQITTIIYVLDVAYVINVLTKKKR